jgi:L-histidine N-alpha-methyltransferase
LRATSDGPFGALVALNSVSSTKELVPMNRPARLWDDRIADSDLAYDREEILAGLRAPQKQLEPRFLYDERGSHLFDRITSLEEYYPTRSEIALLEARSADIARRVGRGAAIVELGAGSSRKARLLLEALEAPSCYVPVDISAAYLAQQAAEVARAFPELSVLPLVADFTEPLTLPRAVRHRPVLLFFPGSTIGNLARSKALALLRALRVATGARGLLIGVDTCADPARLHAAYNDSSGVTAAFNLNLLARLNRELEADFDLEAFDHTAIYDARERRIEMRLVSRCDQQVSVSGERIHFAAGEYLITEHSHKYSPESFADLARAAGWRPDTCWLCERQTFSLHYLTADAARPDSEPRA